jgi:hypothetical protein
MSGTPSQLREGCSSTDFDGAACPSLVSQSNHRVDSHSAAGRNITGCKRHSRKQNRHRSEGEGPVALAKQ